MTNNTEAPEPPLQDGTEWDWIDWASELLDTRGERISELEARNQALSDQIIDGCCCTFEEDGETHKTLCAVHGDIIAERDALKDELKRLQEKAWGPENVDHE